MLLVGGGLLLARPHHLRVGSPDDFVHASGVTYATGDQTSGGSGLPKAAQGFGRNGDTHEVFLVPTHYLWMAAVHWYEVDNGFVDPAHGNALARYTSACMLNTYITGMDSCQNTFREWSRNWTDTTGSEPEVASEADANWITKY